MTLITKHFGVIEVKDEDIVTFAEGLPGFRQLNKFIIMFDDEDESNTFVWLQSVDDGELCFILVDAAAILPWYKPSVLEEELEGLDIKDMNETLIYNITRFPEDVNSATVNLMAPIVINAAAKKGRQVIVTNEDYGVRHYLFDRDGDVSDKQKEG